jgi:predicted Ser/Thr protein kinase
MTTKVKNAAQEEIFALIEQATSDEDLTPWNGELRDYLPMVLENPELNELAHARICRMIGEVHSNLGRKSVCY